MADPQHSTVQNAARVAGVAFVLDGPAGFVPGLTSGLYEQLDFAGSESDAQLLGLFRVSVLHNIVHLLFGVAGLALGRTAVGARAFLLGAGWLYLLLWLLGLAGGMEWLPTDRADDWLHVVLGVGMIAVALATRPRTPPVT